MAFVDSFVFSAMVVSIVGVSVAQVDQTESAQQNETFSARERIILGLRELPRTISEKLLYVCKDKRTTREEVESLILDGASVFYRDHKGVSPLMSAAYYIKDPDVIASLLEAGAEVNIKTNYWKNTPLLAAAYGNQGYEVFLLLLQKGADVRSRAKNGKNVITILIEEGQPTTELIFLLSDSGVPLQDMLGYEEEWLPFLHSARIYPRQELIQKLHFATIDIKEKGEYNKSPLMFALQVKAPLQVIQAMLEAGEDIHSRTILRKNTPLHYAAMYAESAELIDALYKHGADIHAKNTYGETPTQVAIQMNSSLEVIQKLIDLSAENTEQSTSRHTGISPIHHAAERGSPELLQFLIDNGANVNNRCEVVNNPTPLLIASSWNNDPNVLVVLLQAGADVHATNAKGQTALMLAFLWVHDVEDEEVAMKKKEILLNAGALMSAKSKEGKSAADYEYLSVQRLVNRRVGMSGIGRQLKRRDFE